MNLAFKSLENKVHNDASSSRGKVHFAFWRCLFYEDRFILKGTNEPKTVRGRRSRNKVSVGEPAEGSFRWNRPTHPRTVMVGGAPAAPTLLSNQHRKPRTEDRLVGRVLRSALRAGDTNQRQLSTMDILALATMKNAAKCDT